VAGYKPGKGNRTGQVGSLLIGVNDDSGLIYAGHVGTGFSVETLRMLGDGWSRCAARTRRSTGRCRPSMPAPRSG
jgi:ATP-dependent DNA ligase